MYIKDLYKRCLIKTIKLATGAKKEKIEEFVNMVIDRDFTDHDAKIYNNYDDEVIETSLERTLDWIQKERPICVESGVFFKNAEKHLNLNTQISSKQLKERKIFKNAMFKAKEAGDAVGALFNNIMQLNRKKQANAGYGVKGEKRSFLYNPHTSFSVTSAGRFQISVACQCYENWFADNVKFMNMDECLSFINSINDEKDDWKFDINDVLDNKVSKNAFVKRMQLKFKFTEDCDIDILENIYDNLPEEVSTRLFYKCNMSSFMLNKTMIDLFNSILFSDCKFIDPNDPPEKLLPELKLFAELCTEFVNSKYIPFRCEDRAIAEERVVVIVMDTDSNIIYYGELYDFLEMYVFPRPLFRKSEKAEAEQFEQKVVNIVSYGKNMGIYTNLNWYMDKINALDKDRHKMTMKNEYYFPVMITTLAKKSYLGLIARCESLIYKIPKIDTKGVSFYKSTASVKTSKFISTEILKDELLMPKSGKISTKSFMKKVNDFKNQIIDEIMNGEMGYFQGSIKVKSADAYTKQDPLSVNSYKAVYVWNHICKDEDRINLPSTVMTVKVNLLKKANLSALEDYPDIYAKFEELFETVEHIQKKGINTIALPYKSEEVPEWMYKIIDTKTIVSKNMALFDPLFKPLRLTPGSARHNGSKMKHYTNIIKF